MWPQSRVFDLFSQMVQGLYSVYPYVQGFCFPCSLKACTLFLFSDMINFIYMQGTGSAGATVRIYIEQFEPDASKHDIDAQVALKPLIGMLVT